MAIQSRRMKLQAFLTTCLLINYIPTLHVAAEPLVISWLNEESVIYTAEYQIIRILCFNEKFSYMSANDKIPFRSPIVFFILADDSNGERVYKGLYVRKNGVVTRLLENGQDAAYTNNNNTITVYIAARDGIYTYNFITNTVEKYGSMTDSIVGIAKLTGNDEFYIMTTDHVVWKVTNSGTEKKIIPEIVGAKQIIIDRSNHLYYDCNNTVCVYDGSGIKRNEAILQFPHKELMILNVDSDVHNVVLVFADGLGDLVTSDATFQGRGINLTVHPTAVSFDSYPQVYCGYNKKIYEYDYVKVIESMMTKLMEESKIEIVL